MLLSSRETSVILALDLGQGREGRQAEIMEVSSFPFGELLLPVGCVMEFITSTRLGVEKRSVTGAIPRKCSRGRNGGAGGGSSLSALAAEPVECRCCSNDQSTGGQHPFGRSFGAAAGRREAAGSADVAAAGPAAVAATGSAAVAAAGTAGVAAAGPAGIAAAGLAGVAAEAAADDLGPAAAAS